MSGHRFFSFLLLTGLLAASVGCASSRRVAETKPVEKVETVDQEAAPTAAPLDPLSRGYELEAAERWPDAMAFYATVLKAEPANATALHRLGVIATYREDHEAAASYYRRAMELDPHNAELLADAGYFLSLQKQYEPAALMLEQALRLDPENERVINNFAMVQGLRGDFDAALVLYRRINSPVVALLQVASIHEERGEWQLALACYHEARSVDPNVTIPDEVVAQVEQLRHGYPATTAPPLRDEVPAELVLADVALVTHTDSPPPRSRPIRGPSPPGKPAPIQEAVAESTAAEQTFLERAGADDATTEDPYFPDDVASELSAKDTNEPAIADDPTVSPSSRSRDLALGGCCPVTLRDTSQLVMGRSEFSCPHAGLVYHFSSADALRRFVAHPERYIAAAGGLDVISVRSGKMERGSMHFSTWFRNRLFLFTSADHVDEFRSDPLRYVDLD